MAFASIYELVCAFTQDEARISSTVILQLPSAKAGMRNIANYLCTYDLEQWDAGGGVYLTSLNVGAALTAPVYDRGGDALATIVIAGLIGRFANACVGSWVRVTRDTIPGRG